MKDSQDLEQRRREFVDAAEKLFKENGIVDTTVNSIVKELDVAKGLFYYYFKSKDDVIDAISEKYNKDFRQAIQRSLDPANDFDDRLNGFIENTIASFRVMWENLSGKNENIDLTILSSRSLDEAKETAAKKLKELLEEGNELHKTSVPNPDYYAKLLISGIADLASHTEADLLEIKKIIDNLIGKAGK
ncbi:MAG: TetR/AcrR family transcriptional regulator [Solobacterium sp.]|nr:TetR/AcrR family transcriptional regulator [Solobacterium sp.]